MRCALLVSLVLLLGCRSEKEPSLEEFFPNIAAITSQTSLTHYNVVLYYYKESSMSDIPIEIVEFQVEARSEVSAKVRAYSLACWNYPGFERNGKWVLYSIKRLE